MPKRLETAGLVVAFITWNNLMLSFTYSFVSTFIWEFSILFYFPLFYFPLSPVLCLCLTFWTSETQFTAVGSCSLLQGIFPNQESNPGLPHCRQMIYQLSYEGSPKSKITVPNRVVYIKPQVTKPRFNLMMVLACSEMESLTCQQESHDQH